MARVWSEEGKLARWLDVELAALDAWAELGAVPAEDVARDPRDAPSRRRRSASRDRGDDRPRHRRVRRRRRRAARARGPLGAPRADLLGRRRHRPVAADPRGGRARPRRARPRLRRRRRAGRGAPRRRSAIGRSHGIHAEPMTFGWKLAGWAFELDRDRARAARRAGAEPRRPALGHRRHLRGGRPRGRADRLRAPRARAGARLDADDRARPARRAAERARARARPRSSASPSRSATSPAPRCARSRSRSRRG